MGPSRGGESDGTRPSGHQADAGTDRHRYARGWLFRLYACLVSCIDLRSM